MGSHGSRNPPARKENCRLLCAKLNPPQERTYGFHCHGNRAVCDALQPSASRFIGLSTQERPLAIYHAHIKSFSRGKGESSVAAAAYRAGIDLTDTTKRTEHRYSQRKGVRAFHMLAPTGAPPWCLDPNVFWDANEAWESRANARVARELEVSLPAELDDLQREQLALALGQELVDRYKTVVLVAIHQPSVQGDQRNHHVHLLMSARQVGPGGLGERAGVEFDARQGKGAEAVRDVRAWVGQIINDHLDKADQNIRVDHRSLKVQALEAQARGDMDLARELSRPPTKHIGKVATALERKAISMPRVSIFGSPEEDAFEAALSQAQREGRLMETPSGHIHSQAIAERGVAGAAHPSSSVLGAGTRLRLSSSVIRRQSWPRESSTSPMGLRLSKAVRDARRQGASGCAFPAQPEIVEGWLATQHAAVQAAVEAVQAIPGIQLEPEFTTAMETLHVRRIDDHGSHPDVYDETEALTRAIRDYAVAMRDPHDARVALGRARARFSEAESEPGRFRAARIRSAQRRLSRAKKGVSMAAKAHQERTIREARQAMVEASERLAGAFPAAPKVTQESEMDDGVGEMLPDSTLVELRPRPRMRLH